MQEAPELTSFHRQTKSIGIYGTISCEISSQTRWAINVFKMWYWIRIFSPLDKEIKPLNSDTLDIHWKDWHWYFGHQMWTANWTWVWANSERQWWTGKPDMLQFRGHKESDMTELLNNEQQFLYIRQIRKTPTLKQILVADTQSHHKPYHWFGNL